MQLLPGDLATAEVLLRKFHEQRQIFIIEGVRESISLPRQHSLAHYLPSITLFGSPNGLCSSITESKHIKAVKEPWRRSSRFRALIQMLRTITRLDKLAALRRRFLQEGLLRGSTAGYISSTERDFDGEEMDVSDEDGDEDNNFDGVGGQPADKLGAEERLGDAGPEDGPQSLSSITLAATPG